MKKHTYVEDGKQKAEVLKIDTPEDVIISNPTTGEVLAWDGTIWKNVELPEKDIDGGFF